MIVSHLRWKSILFNFKHCNMKNILLLPVHTPGSAQKYIGTPVIALVSVIVQESDEGVRIENEKPTK